MIHGNGFVWLAFADLDHYLTQKKKKNEISKTVIPNLFQKLLLQLFTCGDEMLNNFINLEAAVFMI